MTARIAHYRPYALAILRIVAALLFFEHGLAKLTGFPRGPALPVDFSLHWFSGVIEFIGGALLAAGLFSRVVALIVSGEMAVAYFLSHAPRGFFPLLNGGEAAIFFASYFCISSSPARAPGASTRCGAASAAKPSHAGLAGPAAVVEYSAFATSAGRSR